MGTDGPGKKTSKILVRWETLSPGNRADNVKGGQVKSSFILWAYESKHEFTYAYATKMLYEYLWWSITAPYLQSKCTQMNTCKHIIIAE